MYVIFDVEVVLLSGLLCSWYSDIVGLKVVVDIALQIGLEVHIYFIKHSVFIRFTGEWCSIVNQYWMLLDLVYT